MSPSGNDIEQVLAYWLGKCSADGAVDPSRRRMWFGNGRRYDAVIRARFGSLHERAANGELAGEWSQSARGRLATIILLDQFSRHIHRGKAGAYAQDEVAQRLAADGVEYGADPELIPAGRVFFYLPFEHAENFELQRLSVRSFERLAAAVAPSHRKEYDGYTDYARRHRDIIERFGRFPHRNAILGRTSTLEEIEFLKRRGSAF